jgi:hypothetical protein
LLFLCFVSVRTTPFRILEFPFFNDFTWAINLPDLLSSRQLTRVDSMPRVRPHAEHLCCWRPKEREAAGRFIDGKKGKKSLCKCLEQHFICLNQKRTNQPYIKLLQLRA